MTERIQTETIEEFLAEFPKVFTRDEIDDLKGYWDEEGRNFLILGVFDCRYHPTTIRVRLLDWLDNHPDKLTLEIRKEQQMSTNEIITNI